MKLLGKILYFVFIVLSLAASVLDMLDEPHNRQNRRKGKK